MKRMLFAIGLFVILSVLVQASEFTVYSPDEEVVVIITDGGGLSYSVVFKGREVVRNSRFGVDVNGEDLGADVTLAKLSSG